MTTTEHAAAIRTALKREQGWTARQVSVRSESFSLGSAIRVEIKDPAIPLSVVERIAKPAESGGNRYLEVCYSHEAQAVHARRYADAVQRAINAVTPETNILEPVAGSEFLVGRPNEHRITLWDRRGYLSDVYTVDQAAAMIAQLTISREKEG